MLTVLLSMFLAHAFLAESEAGMPLSLVAILATSLSTTVVVVFRMLVVSQERRVAEVSAAHKGAVDQMAAAHKAATDLQHEAYMRLVAEVQHVWQAFDRGNRIQVIRLCSSLNIAPELKSDAADILSEIDRKMEKP
jgi:hypothetical protein